VRQRRCDLGERKLHRKTAAQRRGHCVDEPGKRQATFSRGGALTRIKPTQELRQDPDAPSIEHGDAQSGQRRDQEERRHGPVRVSTYGSPRSAESSAISMILRAPLASRS